MKYFVLISVCCLVLVSQNTVAHAQSKAQTINRLFSKGIKHSGNKQWKECVLTFKELAAIYPSALVYYNLATCYKNQGEYIAAKKYYERALIASTRPFDPNTTRGASKIKEAQKAIKDIDKKIELQDRLKATVGAAKKHQVNGNYNSAIKNYLEAHAYENNALYLLEAARSAKRLSEVAKTNKQEEIRRALRLVDRALLETVIPLDDKNIKRARALKKKLNTQMQALLQAQEEAMWVEQRIDWKTYTGATTGVVGGVFVTVALAVFGRQVREGYDTMNVNDRDVYDRQLTEINRTKSQGRFLLWSGVALSAIGVGLVVYDLSTVERIKQSKTDARVILGGNQASFVVRF